jgi:Phage major tail protein 2.
MAYNTTPFHGKVCRVEKNNVLMNYSKGWNLSVSLDMADGSYAGQSWKNALPGMASWNGSFEAHFVAGNTEQKAFFDNLVAASPGTQLTDVKFILDGTTNAFSGNIYITGISINGSMGDVVSATVNFQGDGALTLSDAA